MERVTEETGNDGGGGGGGGVCKRKEAGVWNRGSNSRGWVRGEVVKEDAGYR